MPVDKVEFPRAYLDLAKEVQYHTIPGVRADQDFHINIANIAAYCEVVLDGIYSPEDVEQICERLTEKLYKSRRPLM